MLVNSTAPGGKVVRGDSPGSIEIPRPQTHKIKPLIHFSTCLLPMASGGSSGPGYQLTHEPHSCGTRILADSHESMLPAHSCTWLISVALGSSQQALVKVSRLLSVPALAGPHGPGWFLSNQCPGIQAPGRKLWTQCPGGAQHQAEYHHLKLLTHPRTRLPKGSNSKPTCRHHHFAHTESLGGLTDKGLCQLKLVCKDWTGYLLPQTHRN